MTTGAAMNDVCLGDYEDWFAPFELEVDSRDGASGKLPDEGNMFMETSSYAEQQIDDCSLFELPFFGDRSSLEAGGPFGVSSLEDIFDTAFPGELSPRSPDRSGAFKESFRAPSPPVTPEAKCCSLKNVASPEASANSSSSSPGMQVTKACKGTEPLMGVVCEEEGPDSLYTIDVQGSGSSRSSSSMCKLASSCGVEGEFASLESKPQLSELEGDSNNPMGLLDMDLQCKGEQVDLECEEDLGRAASLSLDWLCIPSNMPPCLDFIPVNNVCHHDYLVSDQEPSHKCEEVSSDESENEAEGNDPMVQRRRTAQRALSLARTHSSNTPAPSLPESVASQNVAKQPEKEVVAPPRVAMAVAASPSPATSPRPAVRRRPGRPSRPTAAASEAKVAGAGKRKRATTSKPAVPPVLGQACTQCSTHVTPVWRAGPKGPKTLCNACGVRYMKVAKKK